MSALPLTRRFLADGWRGLLGWIAGLAVVVLIYLPLFPSMQTPELQGILDSLPPELVKTLGYEDITSGAGYTQATLFGLLGFVLLTIAAVSWAAAVTGGAEESGRLELTLAHGVGRVQYALEAAAALLVKLLVLGAITWLLVWTAAGPAELGLDPLKLSATVAAWLGLGALCAGAALAVGAATGRRVWAIGAGTAVAVVGYVAQAVANNTPDLDGLRVISPYDWAFGNAPLTTGADVLGLVLLWGGAIVLTGVATAALARRDILG
jgi:ABC-2 type transport system permease protein